jgi:hypothetical protein
VAQLRCVQQRGMHSPILRRIAWRGYEASFAAGSLVAAMVAAGVPSRPSTRRSSKMRPAAISGMNRERVMRHRHVLESRAP